LCCGVKDEKVKVLKAIVPLEAKNLVRGQFRGYRNEPGVAADSSTETFAAFKSRSIRGGGAAFLSTFGPGNVCP
jgi:glucose-6-phosphate 1-dehydrogenase